MLSETFQSVQMPETGVITYAPYYIAALVVLVVGIVVILRVIKSRKQKSKLRDYED